MSWPGTSSAARLAPRSSPRPGKRSRASAYAVIEPNTRTAAVLTVATTRLLISARPTRARDHMTR